MTVSSTNTKNSYSGDGSTTVFAYTFKIFDDDDITVILRTDATGTETVQTKTTHYSVSGVGNAGGGNITFVSAPASGVTVVLLRETVQTQTTDYTPNDPFPAASHEDALDKLTLIVQDIQEETDRSIKLSRTNTMTSTEFTVGASDRASKVLAFDTSGELSVTQELGTFRGNWSASTAFAERDLIKDTTNNNIYLANTAHTSSGSLPISTNTDSAKWDLIVDAASATTSATNAATSASAAASSATAAAASASAAATSETNAAASEAGVAADASAAAASASSASTSATNAATSETNAATSASAASTSATNAATSATSASNSATSASTSASNAATSATNASNSASAASTSASNAATSESNASTSETNAASSASSAASDASAAAASAAAAAASFDAFDDIYLGAKASAPTVDNDGDALTAGDQYFNTTNSTLYVWNGSAWQAATPDIVGDTTPQLGGNLDTNGNDITFGDNDKATFGDAVGGDLQIYHDGSHSYIEEQGTGNLRLKTNGVGIQIVDSSDLNLAVFNTGNGEAQLYHVNAGVSSNKLKTTSGGIDVTGTASAQTFSADHTTPIVDFMESDATDLNMRLLNNAGDFYLRTINDAKTSGTYRVKVGNSTGDISFYDSTGVTQGFFWDASTQRLGLATTAPATTYQVGDGSADTRSTFNPNSAFAIGVKNGANHGGFIGSNGSSGMQFSSAGGAAQMTIDSSGNVGIGTTAPVVNLTVGDTNVSTYISVAGDRSYFGYDGANATVQSGTGKGLKFCTNNSTAGSGEVARFDSSGRLGIGTTNPNGGKLHVQTVHTSTDVTQANTNSTMNVGNSGTGNGVYNAIKFSGNQQDMYIMSFNNSAQASRRLGFFVGSVAGDAVSDERLSITGNGNVGIGTAAVQRPLHIIGADGASGQTEGNSRTSLYLDNSGDNYINIQTGATNNGAIWFSDTTQNQGGIVYNHTSDYLYLKVNNAERARLDSSGNLLVGGTDVFPHDNAATSGTAIGASGYISIARDGGIAGYFNRMTSDGDILQFRKGGSTVGSIGAVSGDIYIGTGDTTLRFYDAGNSITPRGTDGAANNGVIDLGGSSERFKDLYLSGGVYLGGTGASNLLDDYEEGTWTPTIIAGAGSGTYSSQNGKYTKVGRQVHVVGYIGITNHTGSGSMSIGSLPFTQDNDSANISIGSAFTDNLSYSGDQLTVIGTANSTELRIYTFANAGAWGQVSLDTSFSIHFSATYFT